MRFITKKQADIFSAIFGRSPVQLFFSDYKVQGDPVGPELTVQLN